MAQQGMEREPRDVQDAVTETTQHKLFSITTEGILHQPSPGICCQSSHHVHPLPALQLLGEVESLPLSR